MKIYAIRDNAIEAYGQPIFVRAQGQAVRSFIDECNNPESQLNKHPADYDLYYIGEYNDVTGELTPHGPERVARATDHVKAQ